MNSKPPFDMITNSLEENDIPESNFVYDQNLAEIVRSLLIAVGEDPERSGLQRTPERVARMYKELLSGYTTDLDLLVNDAIFTSDYENQVLVKDIEYYSLCEHHLLPFYGRAHVAYIPNGRIIGLSKIPRLVDMFSRRLQVQERMTGQIAETLENILGAKGVAVLVEGTHLCAAMRGVKKPGTQMVTSAFRGIFKTNDELRRGFMDSIRG